jgi:hypothetical protein
MKISPLLLASVTTLGITACAEIPEQEVQSRPPPSQEVITALAKNIYTSVNRKAPKDLQVTSISRTNIFPNRQDTLVCMTAVEEVLSQILLKFECGDQLDTITLRAPQIAETR